ncbi:glycosyltransferase family 2 protein [Geminocystis sp. NIES-3709]|uniref:glycosyltransferase family 2 protein n=1 Tax=Geminocystis sp. NIES-3709 TaxID=1617448 RepID=UPI0005FC701D|nr:glycosyltransferase family 2 protein [Geminocystis sp. NIES-3709]BAQ66181.1 glycosyl transferase [Geminocystis sp. NIES-3709]
MRCVTLSELPPPPQGKTGWPWTQESPPTTDIAFNDSDYPKISIITPNYNYGQFLEETIRSVLLQGYPNLEYIVIDGGSTDNSVEIIKKYESWLTYWVSEKDLGQVSAINKGIELSTGKWFNWLNSDDILLANSLKTLIEISKLVEDPKWITGGRLEMSESGSFSDICIPWRYNLNILAFDMVEFPQDATFIRLDFLKENNIKLSEKYPNVFDPILYLDLINYAKPILTTAVFSAMRWHKDQKTINQVSDRLSEILDGISPYIQKLPLFDRLILRLETTRFYVVVRLLLAVFIWYGIKPSMREYICVKFNLKTGKFESSPARFSIFI